MASEGQQLIGGESPPMLPGIGPGAQPRIEVVTGHEQQRAEPPPARGTLSLVLWFLAAFALVLVPTSIWNFSRPPVYRATATVLTTVPAARSGAGGSEADIQHVAIQRQLLLGRELLTDTLTRVTEQGVEAPASADDLRPMLAVDAVPGTNLVELSAEGRLPLLLSELVNAWLTAYEDLRQSEIKARVGTQLDKLANEGDALEQKISDKRAALEQFRERHDIVTLERDSNQALKRLSTLQTSLADAEDEQIKAKARLAAMEAAFARGEPVLAEAQANALAQLKQQESELEVRVKQMRKRYTEMFIQNDPDKRALPEGLARLRARIETVGRQGAQAALTAARRELETSTDRLFRLQREFAEQKRRASRFSTSFAQYQDLQADLAALDDMQRSTESELVAVEAKAIDDYPQIEIIEPAYPPRDPVRPNYLRDLGLSTAAAGGAGLLMVLGLLLFDAARRPRPAGPMTGVRIWGDDPMASHAGRIAAGNSPSQLEHDGSPATVMALPDSMPRQLMGGEVEALWELADNAERQLMGLLLCGLDEAEVATVGAADFDLTQGRIRVPSDARSIQLPPMLAALFADAEPLPAWQSAEQAQELGRRISLLALDAGLAHAAEVTPAVLRHTYLVFLVRQGARLTELHRIAGRMNTTAIQRYAPLSPAGTSRPLEQLELIYPALT